MLKIVTINKAATGIIRRETDGATAELKRSPNGTYSIVFTSYDGTPTKAITVQENAHYIVDPNHVKILPPLHMDPDMLRRWAREFGNGIDHRTYFELVPESLMRTMADSTGQFNANRPETTKHLAVEPSPGITVHVCLVSNDWMKSTTYEQFCHQMELPLRQTRFFDICTEYAKKAINGYKQMALAHTHQLSIEVAGQQILAGYNKKGQFYLGHMEDDGKGTKTWLLTKVNNIRKPINEYAREMSDATMLAREMCKCASQIIQEGPVEKATATLKWDTDTL